LLRLPWLDGLEQGLKGEGEIWGSVRASTCQISCSAILTVHCVYIYAFQPSSAKDFNGLYPSAFSGSVENGAARAQFGRRVCCVLEQEAEDRVVVAIHRHEERIPARRSLAVDVGATVDQECRNL
jgi:hypothetical protein